MKFVLVLVVVVVAVWLLFGRRRGAGDAGGDARAARQPSRRNKGAPEPQQMVSCTHCGLHLPQSDALTDAQGRHFCSEAHRLAGPR